MVEAFPTLVSDGVTRATEKRYFNGEELNSMLGDEVKLIDGGPSYETCIGQRVQVEVAQTHSPALVGMAWATRELGRQQKRADGDIFGAMSRADAAHREANDGEIRHGDSL